ncbi:ribosome biogenesis factor YjgA [Basilea psittacipulmonis]|uniref:Dual-action ribosomal maturation protein DarP n=1 Tax=Basilea psittacipulmonis DSM 24701 TaxID=1072685 RepID=A0A077DDL8_9BURK|nr:ribosome biogenesis factor YjgA [Basilea psittacipulmonis]AIL32975.1 hypothetical protein IX83_06295 [Basilea psittacipulmonis DSM 24701]
MTEYTQVSTQEDERPSKSQIKRELHAILDLGKELVDLPEGKLKQLPLSEKTLENIFLAQKISAHGGKKRQIHYVGKLLRTEDIDSIQRLLETWKNGSKEETAHMHRLEMLRDRLIASDAELTTFLSNYPQADIQKLRATIRAARKEQTQENAPKKHYRALFQELKLIINE